jgi:hypothetical protein
MTNRLRAIAHVLGVGLTTCITLTCLFTGARALGCGVNSHLWITDSAICQLPEGSTLRDFFSEARHVDLTRLGSAFPDSGYVSGHPYGEYAHWSPFVEAYIRSFRSRVPVDPERWGPDELDEVAFIMGVAAHGVEDEWFDTQFLRWAHQEDGVGQDTIDPNLDFILIAQRNSALYPELYYPLEGVTLALNEAGVPVDAETIEGGVRFLHDFALKLTQNPEALESMIEVNEPVMPWTMRHYLNPAITGSLGQEPRWIARLFQSVWSRIYDQFIPEEALLGVDPIEGYSLRRADVASEEEGRWVSLYIAIGAEEASLRASVRLVDERGVLVPSLSRSTRWSDGEGLSRIYQVAPLTLPSAPLNDQGAPLSAQLWLEVDPGVRFINGAMTTEEVRFPVTVDCGASPCADAPSDDPTPLRWGGEQQGCWEASPRPDRRDLMEGGVMSAGVEMIDMSDDRGGAELSIDREEGGDEGPDLGIMEAGGDSTSGVSEVGGDSIEREDQMRAIDVSGDEEVRSRGGSAHEGCALSSSPPSPSGSHLLCLFILWHARRSLTNASRQSGVEV